MEPRSGIALALCGIASALSSWKVAEHDYLRNCLRSMAVQSIDFAEANRCEEELQRSAAYLAEAQRLSRTGSFRWCVRTRSLNWSAETFAIMGYDQTIKPTLDLVLKRVHPADAALVEDIVRRATRD